MKAIKSLNLKLGILFLFLFILASLDNAPKQTVAPKCFSRADCWVPIPSGYCGVNYDCISGVCYSYSTKCSEVCGSGKDEDLDGAIDCNDSDCWSNPTCHCNYMSFNQCKVGRCYCPLGQVPKWTISEDGNLCACM